MRFCMARFLLQTGLGLYVQRLKMTQKNRKAHAGDECKTAIGKKIKYFVLIGLMQLCTRCSDSSCQAQEDLIAGFSAIEAEAELVQVRLKMCAATVICAKQKCFQVADGFVQPMQVAGFILFRVQFHARQVPIASVAVAFDFCTCGNSFADDLLKCFARDVFHDLHPREQSRAIFRF